MHKSPMLVVLLILAVSDVSEGETLREQRERLLLSRALMTLDNCQQAVWSCCQSDRDGNVLPVHCFEGHRCFGLHWEGADACSASRRDEVAKLLEQAIKKERNNEHWSQ